MITSIISTLDNCYTTTQQHKGDHHPYCTLVWRRDQLLVKPLGKVKQPYLPVLDNEQSLAECLKRSSVKLVRIDPKLGEAKLNFWANACEQASKPIYLRVNSSKKYHTSESTFSKVLRGLIDWIVALLLLLVTSPVAFVLALSMHLSSSEPVLHREWHVGERGKLFRGFKFRTTSVSRKTGLHNLPLLLNVVRGEMSLSGPRCWTLTEALELSAKEQQQLNQLPGVVGSWQIEEAESNQLILDSANSFEM
ncbi:MAG: sugar transferase [Pelatocladus maniniholoensis HA4357-MV3]|jgi:lipopolysaccharide/colanic/teichoic acid biosynthesis glycosyltransferase|uniref:Sugar transferase n=1 Tax=Pelatocladus maniniholoensis HA4357-MV3 TaxID=1117104 RepID=A0A9E3LTG1_9NOST|nr:sugar transferase [Pelatocladus maniniholoensis HA4357-MV3]